jgi:vitamin B12 transporter
MRRMRTISLVGCVRFAAAIAALAAFAGAASAVSIQGVVRDRAGKPIEYANVRAAVLERGAITDDGGRFALEVPAGSVTLEIAQIGYMKRSVTVAAAEGMAPLAVTLEEEPVPVSEVVVAASSFGKSGKSEGAVLKRMDVMMTPGGAADVFQSLRALPGINAPDEGAALYVRGGDPRETLVRLDGGEIGHPYHYEGASGGLFSAFDAYMLKSAFFSSGGFSSKYGGVLSGVLDIETQDPLGLRTFSLGANMVGAGASSSWALIPEKLSLVGTVRFSAVDLLDKLYGSPSRYTSIPSSQDGAIRLLYRYSPTGRIAFLYLGSTDQVALISNELNFEGEFAQHSSNHFGAIQFQEAIGERLAIKGQVAGQRYETRWSFGPIAIANEERNGNGNVDLVWAASPNHELSFGGNVRRPDERITGTTVADSVDFSPGAPTREILTHARLWDRGFYLEDKLRVWGPLYATIGGRMDHATVPGTWTWDPRAALAWRLSDLQTIRVAAGRYHQLPDPVDLDPRYGNPDLEPLSADHVIAGYEWRSGTGNVRVEAYHKEYDHLVTQSATTFHSNEGHGFARGVDAFLQGSRGKASGWISYGYLDSKRREKDDPREVPSAYGVKHSLTLVTQYALTGKWHFGARYGHSTGRPYTPVIGRSFDPGRRIWRPILGENHSDRLPDYHRLDLRATRLFSIPAGLGLPSSSVCALYVECMNALGTRNVLRWVWNSDYSQRYPDESYFSRRLAVAGLALTW